MRSWHAEERSAQLRSQSWQKKILNPATPRAPAVESNPQPEVIGLSPPPEFSVDVSLKKIHAMLVLDRSSSMLRACPFLLSAAIRFSRLFVDGRDSLGVIEYGDVPDLTLPMTDHFKEDVASRISKIRCGGDTNTGGALELAQWELARLDDSDAVNTVILFTDGQPNVLNLNWPIRPRVICKGPQPTGDVPGVLTWGMEFPSS
jgi:Mg-chelatase subunit ChlD